MGVAPQTHTHDAGHLALATRRGHLVLKPQHPCIVLQANSHVRASHQYYSITQSANKSNTHSIKPINMKHKNPPTQVLQRELPPDKFEAKRAKIESKRAKVYGRVTWMVAVCFKRQARVCLRVCAFCVCVRVRGAVCARGVCCLCALEGVFTLRIEHVPAPPHARARRPETTSSCQSAWPLVCL